MAKRKIVLYTVIPDDLKQRLMEHFEVISFAGIDQNNYQNFITALSEAEGLIGSGVSIKGEVLSKAKQLKAISTISVGYDYFSVEELTARNIRLMHTPGVLTDTTADLIFALLLTTARRIVETSEFIHQGRWTESIDSSLFGVDVHHKKIGILGMGNIGEAVAKRAYCGFDMEVLYFSRQRKPAVEQKYQAIWCELDQLLKQADFVCITLPLTSDTENLITREKLALMKSSSILINGGRGKIIDEDALIEALQTKQILGAGLDVFVQEPLPTNSALLTLPNVVLAPHIGSATFETRYKMAALAVENLIAALQPEKPKHNLVNKEVD
ncbi:NAD(P)-dependent oxidoreductase [Gallibacterium melopsittaci]|uniref:NAD(P)-dependent oxidoreductase n=1 Tax=Gallibacterium melopsittaci TaxID=516063 RepID=A0ABV6HZC6_9PAST